jgi:adenine-specific DNA methylase
MNDKSLAETCDPKTSYPLWNSLTRHDGKNGRMSLLDDATLRDALLDFIADFAKWENSSNKVYLQTCRQLTQAAHVALGGLPGSRPLVVDPFAGGGAIPLEALRAGADAFASDLNPVAVLLEKVVLEYIPKFGERLANEFRRWGDWIKKEAETELSVFYPKDPDGSSPMAYLWARTILCEGPGCGSEVPLIRSLWLANKGSRSIALQIVPNKKRKCVDFTIIEKQGSRWFMQTESKTEIKNPNFDGTVRRGSATCPVCGYTTPVSSVRTQLKARKGGAADARLFCVVTTKVGEQGRFYRLPNDRDITTVRKAASELEVHMHEHKGALSLVPDEPTPKGGGRGAGRAFSQRNYGMNRFEDLFAPRQALALTTLTRLVIEAGEKLSGEHEQDMATAVQTLLAFAIDKQADLGNSLNRWEPVAQCPRQLFGRQAIPMIWDFAEGTPLGSSSGSFEVFVDGVYRALVNIGHDWREGHAEVSSATAHPLPNDSANAFITDPPYYDAVPYADLSDFFYVWLKRAVGNRYPDLLQADITPKDDECIVDEVKGKDKSYFERTMTQAMTEGRRLLAPSGIGVVVFAHKSTSGWEAQLQAMIDAGWTITGSWPLDTENTSRLRAQDSAALTSSVHLACRPREKADGTLASEEVGDWRDVLAELPERIHEWMPRLSQEKVEGADAIFSCLGPALEIFSRYSRVEKASGEEVRLREYLEYVWAAVAREALNMIFTGADTTGFEPDARLTAMWLWTLASGESAKDGNSSADSEDDELGENEDEGGPFMKVSGYVMEYDTARKIAQGLGAYLEQLRTVVSVKGDKARLLPVSERAQYLFERKEQKTANKPRKRAKQQSFFDGEIEQDTAENMSETSALKQGATVLDRVHQSMLLFAAGRADALKRFLVDEGAGNDQRFWQLAQALSALYPKSSDEKRWVDGVLLRKKGLGF